jgi:ElaB/YqjD/DUF883 family membrane-anchored ribosome-binding protein
MDIRDRVRTGDEQPWGAWAESQARGIDEAARQSRDETARAAKDYAAEAQEYVQGAVQQTREYVEGAMQHTRDKMAEYRQGGIDRVKGDLASYTREQPMTALLIAAGAGLVLGWLSAAGRR